MQQVRDWLVAADDRTGALEVAAELARAGRPVRVDVGEPGSGACVVDIGTRHMAPADAARRVAVLPRAAREGHKIDSTLRGNWAHELRTRARGGRAIVVAAWPAMGRTCVRGVVHVHGAEHRAVRDDLPEAVLLATPEALGGWLRDGDGIGAVDVASDEALRAVAHVIAPFDVLVAGPAGALGAVLAPRGVAAATPPLRLPALVVCGSATAISREQVDRLRAARPDVDVLAADPPAGELDPEVSARLARQTIAHPGVVTLVVVGGDTAAAVLGTAARLVGGYAAPGMPWSTALDGSGPLVVTKAGSFGGPDALVDLLGRETG